MISISVPHVLILVEVRGFEPRTPCMPCKYSSQLSYTPIFAKKKRRCFLNAAAKIIENTHLEVRIGFFIGLKRGRFLRRYDA